MKNINPTNTQAWKALEAHQSQLVHTTIADLFKQEENRFNDYSLTFENQILVDFSKNKEGERTIAASGGILFWPEAHLDCIRPGIIMYGISPTDTVGAEFGLTPVMNLTSSLLSVREHKKGEPVGYGGIWTSPKETKIGVVAIGYGDGYPRDVPEGTPVYLNGRIVPIVGRVSMDMLTVDLGADSQDKVGDEVILWGKELPIETVAKYSGILSYELITKLTPRVITEYVD